MEDHTIVDLYLARDEQAIRATADKYGERLQGLARRILEDQPEAQECENDTYLAAWNRIPPHQPREYLFAFLARITRGLAFNRIKEKTAQKRPPVTSLSEELEQCLPAPDDTPCRVEYGELLASIEAFLNGLKSADRVIFMRRYWFCDSVATIASLLGVTESRVKSSLFRTRNRLRQHLTEEGYAL